jgi:hypothetical protein
MPPDVWAAFLLLYAEVGSARTRNRTGMLTNSKQQESRRIHAGNPA